MSEARPGSVGRVLDAAANRAREGLRVAEDYARFIAGKGDVARELREARHRVTELVARLAGQAGDAKPLLAERDTPGDPGADPDAFATPGRATPEEVAASSLKRAEEALRSLAEFSKLVVKPDEGAAVKPGAARSRTEGAAGTPGSARGRTEGPAGGDIPAGFDRVRYSLYDIEKRLLVPPGDGN